MTKFFPLPGWIIALVEAVLIGISFGISYYLRYEMQFLRPLGESFYAPFRPYISYTVIFAIWMLLLNNGAKLYEHSRDRSLINEIFKLTGSASNAVLLVMAISFLLRPLVFSRLMLLQAAIIAIGLCTLWRISLRIMRNRLYRRGIGVEKVLVIGAGDIGRHVIRTLVARPDLGYRPVGLVDDDPERGTKNLGRVPALGSIDNLAAIINEHEIDLVIVTLPWGSQRRILEIVQECERENVAVRTVPDLFQLNMSQIKVEMLGGVPLLGVRKDLQLPRSKLIAKRVMDIAITVLLLPVALPVMAITALAVRLDSEGPILFVQDRVGLNGQTFKFIKFRSMVDGAEALHETVTGLNEDEPEGYKGQYKGDDPRITKVGKLIRRTSLDELPQLFNVIRGDMSLVGPRPALVKEVLLYKPWHAQRLIVRPGITGLWQVSGRSEIPFEEKCLLDIYYIENWSLALDLQILAQTAPQVLFGKGAY